LIIFGRTIIEKLSNQKNDLFSHIT